MRVKLCGRCPYTPRDLADHYDPDAVLYACAKCDGEPWILNPYDPTEVQRRRQCTTTFETISMILPSVAPSATDGLDLSATTPGEPRSVQRSAWIASRPAERAITDGCVDFALPDDGCGVREISASTASGNKEVAG